MKLEIKNIFPVFLSLFNLLFFEIVNNTETIKQNLQIDIQTVGNVLVLMISTYSIWRIIVEREQKDSHLEICYLNYYLTILNAFVLNVGIFENKIERILDFFSGWHTIWSILFLVLSLWFTGIGKSTYDILKNIVCYIMDIGKALINWGVKEINNTHKGILVVVSLGLIIWLVLLLPINKEKSEFFMGQFFKDSFIFWCAWFIICMFIFFAVNFLTKIGQVVKDIKNMNIIKFFLWAVMSVAALFVLLQVFPSIFPLIGNMLSFPLIIYLAVAAVVYFGKEKFAKMFMINWKDFIIVCGIFILVTFILLPIIGAVSEKGQKILASDTMETFQSFMELITIGIGVIKESS